MELRSHEGQVHGNAKYFCKFDIFKRVSQRKKDRSPQCFRLAEVSQGLRSHARAK